ncbi:MAG: helix-turn-helix domain-containing protein [Xanthobacteraceae bacterium]
MSAGWHPADIVAAVRKRGTSLRALSRRHGKGDSTLRAALIKPATPSNTIIADFLGVSLHELWPAWFDRAGRRISAANPAKRRASPSSQKRRTA